MKASLTPPLPAATRDSAATLAAERGGSGVAPPLLDQPLVSFKVREPVSCAPDTPLGEVLDAMRQEHVGAMVVVDDERRPLGVFTLRDVLEKVALRDVEAAQPIASVMSATIFSLPAQAQGFEAAVVMAREGVRYILVVEDDRLVGVVSESRLFSVWRGGIGDTSAVIRAARDLDALVAAIAGIGELVDRLLDERLPAESITRIISTLNDLVTQRLIDIVGGTATLRDAGACWIALGSQGRGEQTLATDQDNAIIFADDRDADAHRQVLLPFARRMNQALDRCGYPLCRGDVMAGNPAWCLSLREWRERFARWIDVPDPQALLNASIFFDFRPIAGDPSLAHDLRAWLTQYAEDRGRFLLPMAHNAMKSAVPLGLLRDFKLSRGGEHPGTLDLKINGVQLVVESARILALANGIPATNTPERLAGLVQRGKSQAAQVEAWTDAFRVIQQLRLSLNAAQRRRGEPLHNALDPATLNGLERRVLKEALRQAQGVQSRLARELSIDAGAFGA